MDEPGSFVHEDRRLAYRVYGEGSRVTVLLHGLLLNQRMHVPLARALAARGNRVVTLDLRGHGRSDRPPDMWRYGMGFFAQDVVALLDHLGSTRRSSAARRWARTRRSRSRRSRPSGCAGW